MLEELVFSDTELLKEVFELSQAEALASDIDGRNGANIELQLVKSFNRRAAGGSVLVTQRQLQKYLQGSESAVEVQGSTIAPGNFLNMIKTHQNFEAVDLFLVRFKGMVVEILDWASLKTCQVKRKARSTSTCSDGEWITIYNDPQGEIANCLLNRPSTMNFDDDICKVFNLVIIRNADGLAANFCVIKSEFTPRCLKALYERDPFKFVDRSKRSEGKSTSYNRGVKVKFGSVKSHAEGFTMLVEDGAVDPGSILERYREIYSLHL
jgi:hypothetical protein